MKVNNEMCWLKAPVVAPGQLSQLTVIVDGVAFTSGLSVASRRMQYMVPDAVPARIEGGSGQIVPERMKNRPTHSRKKKKNFHVLKDFESTVGAPANDRPFQRMAGSPASAVNASEGI